MVGKGTLIQKAQAGGVKRDDAGAPPLPTPGKSTLTQPAAQAQGGGAALGWMPGKYTADSQTDTLQKATNTLSVDGLFNRYLSAMRDGLDQTMTAANTPDVDEDNEWLSALLEIAVDTAIVASAEGLAGLAIESIAAHLAEHSAEKLVENETLKEAVKATFEGSAKALTKPSGKVDTSELKAEFARVSHIQQDRYRQQFIANLPKIATVIQGLPDVVAQGIIQSLNATDPERLNALMELRYTAAWLNFLARAKHGFAKGEHKPTQTPDGKIHGADNVDPDGIDRFKTDGSFQRPAHLEGVLECNVAYDTVTLDNVPKAVRDSLRRIARTFPGMRVIDLKMNMLVRDGSWGEASTTEIVVGADGAFLTGDSPHAQEMRHAAWNLPVSLIREDRYDREHDK